MPGYMSLLAPCLRCDRMFASNASFVPNVKGQPICKDCITELQAIRISMGMEPWFIHPQAYEPEEVM